MELGQTTKLTQTVLPLPLPFFHLCLSSSPRDGSGGDFSHRTRPPFSIRCDGDGASRRFVEAGSLPGEGPEGLERSRTSSREFHQLYSIYLRIFDQSEHVADHFRLIGSSAR